MAKHAWGPPHLPDLNLPAFTTCNVADLNVFKLNISQDNFLAMIPKQLRTNAPLGGMGRGRFLKFQATQISELARLESLIESATNSIDEGDTAVTQIEHGIRLIEPTLATYKANLVIVGQNITRIVEISPVDVAKEHPLEPGYMNILRLASTLILSGSSSDLERLKTQREELKTRILHLGSMLSSLKQDLHDWKVQMVFNQQSLLSLIASKEATESVLENIKYPLSSMKLVPPEIWIKIFQIGENMRVQQGDGREKKSLALAASQVCMAWRNITLEAPHLWKNIEFTLPPVGFNQLVARTQKVPVTLIAQAHPAGQWARRKPRMTTSSGYGYPPWPNSPAIAIDHPTIVMAAPPSDYRHSFLPQSNYSVVKEVPNDYSFHVNSESDHRDVTRQTITKSFYQPTCVTVQRSNPGHSNLLEGILSPLTGLTRLVLVNIWPSNPTNLTESLANLKYLKLDLGNMSPFSLEPFLASGLEELHIQHANDATVYSPQREYKLSKLHTLAITLHEQSLCSMLVLPALRTLVLHASTRVGPVEPVLQILSSRNVLLRITNISFDGWKPAKVPIRLKGQKVANNQIPFEVVNWIARSHQLTLQISNSVVLSSDLISLLQKYHRITTVTLAYCVGITQAECEVIEGKVEKLNVYV